MKILSIILFFLLVVSATTTDGPQLAQVNQQEGIYIFVDSKPVGKYQYLGTVKTNCARQYQGIKNKLIKQAKKQYPKANGIILNFATGGIDKADVIFLE